MLSGVPYSVIAVALVGVEMADVDDGTGQKSRSYVQWRDWRQALEQCIHGPCTYLMDY